MVSAIEAPERRISFQIDSAPERLAEVEGVLNLEKYQGLYGILYIAGEATPDRIPHILNPDPSDPVLADDLIKAENKLPERVNFNPIAGKLSISERKRAWEGVDFDEALKSWVEKRVDSARNTTDEKKILVLEKIYGKTASEINEHDVLGLYYESGGEEDSDIDGFINRVENAFSTDRMVDAKVIKDHIQEIEAVAAGFFGKNTARVIARGVELKAEIRNNPQRVLDEVIHANGRLNKLNPYESDILAPLYESFSDIQTSNEPDPNTSPARQPEIPTEVQEHVILESEDETHGSFKAYPEIKPEEIKTTSTTEVNLSVSENFIADLAVEMSDNTEGLKRKEIIIDPSHFRDEIISKWANISKNTGKILPSTSGRPNEIRFRDVEWEEESDRRVNYTVKNKRNTKEIMVRRDSTHIPGRRGSVNNPAMELEDFYEKLVKWVNSLSKNKNWKLYRADVVNGNIVLNVRRK